MNRRDLDELVSISEWPCVSIIVPMERRSPDNQQNEIRLKTALRLAHEKLAADLPPEERKPVEAKLARLLEGVDLYPFPQSGFALFASPTFARRYEIPFTVRERVVVDRVFAVRELVVAFTQGVRWRAVVLGGARPRLFEGWRERLAELPVGEHAASLDEELARARAIEALPTVLVGNETDVQTFERHSAHARDVIAILHGRHDRESADQIGHLLWPVASKALEDQRLLRFRRELDAGIKTGRLTSGIEDVWLAAHQGRGEVLLVEERLQFPVEPGVGQRALLRAPAGLEANNAIDEIVDVVLSMKGQVIFVPPGSLREHQGIALVTRYAAVKEVA